jgi:FYVE zinc finger
MTWQEFQDIVRHQRLDETSPLIMSGVQHDNGFSGLTKYGSADFDKPESGSEVSSFSLLASPTQISLTPNLWSFSTHEDFVWTGGGFIRCGGSGGHPALAMTDTVYCAGRTIERGFFFHSGHYKPKLKHGLSFFVTFVKTCAQAAAAGERNAVVDRLCSGIWLQFYRSGTAGKKIERPFTFSDRYAPKVATVGPGSTSSSSGSVPRSNPMSIDGAAGLGLTSSQPITIGGKSGGCTTVMPSTIVTPKVDTFGESAYVRHINESPNVHLTTKPVWISDGEVSKCHKCGTTFGFITRKHHCRQCGNIFCSNCCFQKKVVKYPAKNPSSTEDPMKPLRVCNTCFNLRTLI